MQAVERPDAPDVPDGYVGALGLLALIDVEHGRTESTEAWARQAMGFAREQFQADSWTASLAHLGLALACAATGRLDEAEREALRGERLRRLAAADRWSRSRPARARAGPRRAIAAGARRQQPRARAAGRSRSFAIRDGYPRSQPPSSRTSPRPERMPRNRHIVEQPSPAELAVLRVSRPVYRDARSASELYISLNTVKTHTRELYRKLAATSRKDAVARAESARPARSHRITRVILGAQRPKPRPTVRHAEATTAAFYREIPDPHLKEGKNARFTQLLQRKLQRVMTATLTRR